MKTYSTGSVERLLRNYVSVRGLLSGNPPQSQDDNAYVSESSATRWREKPFGATNGDMSPWPFMETRHAKPPRDGKARARAREELHVAVLDLEGTIRAKTNTGEHLVSQEDWSMLFRFYVIGDVTLEELARERGSSSRGSMYARMRRAVDRLASAMEQYAHGF